MAEYYKGKYETASSETKSYADTVRSTGRGGAYKRRKPVRPFSDTGQENDIAKVKECRIRQPLPPVNRSRIPSTRN